MPDVLPFRLCPPELEPALATDGRDKMRFSNEQIIVAPGEQEG